MMRKTVLFATTISFCLVLAIYGQSPDVNPSSPILRVTVIERTTNAVNYHYRLGPTEIDFKGTVLLPRGRGSATVESKPGRTEIDARLDGLADPQQFGREYMTYVLWALTPEGRPHNMGEVIANSSDKARLHVSTDLQAFAMIVTAEPYSAVRQPGDVVVMENRLRPDTIGRVQQVKARFELLPRGHYAWNVPDNMGRSLANTPKVSMKEYEALTELYQAQNAIGIANQAGASQYAVDTMLKARALLADAERWHSNGREQHQVVELAREAAQTAEDARLIAERRKQDQQLADARAASQESSRLSAQAVAETQRARMAASSAQAEAEAHRLARQRAEADLAAARDRAAQLEARAADAERARAEAEAKAAVTGQRQKEADQRQKDADQKRQVRMQLMASLNGVLPALDTARGLVVMLPDNAFHGSQMRDNISSELARICTVLSPYPGLRIEVEGHMDSSAGTEVSWTRAEAVRLALIRRGLRADAVSAHGYGNSRPLGPNTSFQARETNRRVELVITGDAIGSLALWDRSYNLTLR